MCHKYPSINSSPNSSRMLTFKFDFGDEIAVSWYCVEAWSHPDVPHHDRIVCTSSGYVVPSKMTKVKLALYLEIQLWLNSALLQFSHFVLNPNWPALLYIPARKLPLGTSYFVYPSPQLTILEYRFPVSVSARPYGVSYCRSLPPLLHPLLHTPLDF